MSNLGLLCCAIILSGCGASDRVNPNIAFMGDSITNYWTLPTSNLGVPGDITAQMLARFPSEVVGQRYKVVVILGGTNDVRNVNFPIKNEVTTAIANLGKMAVLGQQAKLIVVLCSIPPIENLDDRAEALNVEIAKLAQAQNYLYVDYYTPMVNHPEYFKDALHPNDAGYAVMKTALEKVVKLSY